MAGQRPPRLEEWIEHARQGDPDAFRLLYEFYEAILRAYIYRRVPAAFRSKVFASDVIQESWLTAHKKLSTFQYRGEGSFQSWLLKIVDHKLRDELRHFRTRKRDTRREGPDVDTAQPRGKARTPSSVASAHEDWERIARRLDRLPPLTQRVIELVHQGRSWAQVAEQVGRSAEAVRKVYTRAIDELGREPGDGATRAPRQRRSTDGVREASVRAMDPGGSEPDGAQASKPRKPRK